MPSLGERQIFIGILVVLSVATLFCLIGLATPGWAGYSLYDYSTSTVGRSAMGLGIISILLLIACGVIAVIILTGIVKHNQLPTIFVALLIVTSIFLLGTFAPLAGLVGYSANLIITAFFFTYISSIGATYWLSVARGASGNMGTSSDQQQKQYQGQQQQPPPRLDMS
jgi:hypothetical protein